MLIRNGIVYVLAAMLCLPAAAGQETPVRSARQSFRIFVLEGNGAVNSISSGSGTAPVVEVRDERNLPVQDVEVVFQLPADGPGGSFSGRRLTWSGRTDSNGQAAPSGFVPNRRTGRFYIQVSAGQGAGLARAMITQTNSSQRVASISSRSRKHSAVWKILAGVAIGGGIGGAVWATRGKAGKPTVVLQPGTVSLGGPR